MRSLLQPQELRAPEESLFTSLLSARCRDGYRLLTPINLPWESLGWDEVLCWFLSWLGYLVVLRLGRSQCGSRSRGDTSVGISCSMQMNRRDGVMPAEMNVLRGSPGWMQRG